MKTLSGKTLEEIAIERLKTFEPPEGYWVAYSGGKDSERPCCVEEIVVYVKMAIKIARQNGLGQALQAKETDGK